MITKLLKTIDQDKDEMEWRRNMRAETHIETNYHFLQTHKGFRKNKIGLLIAPTSGGKSTLVRSFLIDFEKNNPSKKALVILSEEYVDELLDELSDAGHQFSENIFAISEKEIIEQRGKESLILYLSEVIGNIEPDLVIYDNITTSVEYNDKKANEQQEHMIRLERMPKRYMYHFLIIAHSNKVISNNNCKLITMSDLRGSANIANRAQYCYILQTWYIDDKIVNFITIEKSRGHNRPISGFKLFYDQDRRIYYRDEEIPREIMNELRKARQN